MVRSGDGAARRRDAYHHGNLRGEMVRFAEEVIAEHGPAALSLREVARRAGVSHSAATHHFGDKAGLLTALAVDGLTDLAARLAGARPQGFLEVGVAYVRFAVDRPGAFAVMFDQDLVHAEDPALTAARAEAGRALHGEVGTILPAQADAATGAIAAWALVHGLAALIRGRMIPSGLPSDPEELTRAVAVHLAAGE
jgi:AcrR family transcriptional regulator